MSWPYNTDGQKGTIVKTRMATYIPRFRVGASSEVTASEVSSQMPAPTPDTAMPAVEDVRYIAKKVRIAYR